jgi:chromosome segregation ATPase
MLLNEFLREHKTVEDLKSALRKEEAIVAQLKDDRTNHEATISNLKKALDAMVARLNEQDSKIQRVSDQLEFSKTVPQAVVIGH